MVPVFPRVRLEEFAIETLSLMPSKLTAFPYFPDVQPVPFVRTPVLPFPDASAVVFPLPSLKPYAATKPGELCATTGGAGHSTKYPTITQSVMASLLRVGTRLIAAENST